MEEETQNSGGKNKMVMPTVIIALVVFAAIGFYLYSNISASDTAPSPTGSVMEQAPSPSGAMEADTAYKDGTYSVVGNYVSPGGPRELNVTITLSDGVITTAETEGTATDATSQRFQGEFVDNFQPQVVGKNIDEVNLTKVAGSSLSPKGFNDALEKVKAEAQS